MLFRWERNAFVLERLSRASSLLASPLGRPDRAHEVDMEKIRLKLNIERLRALTPSQLQEARGGWNCPHSNPLGTGAPCNKTCVHPH
jgi:hypothetical protein